MLWLGSILYKIVIVFLICSGGLVAYRIFDAMRPPRLRKWHRFVPNEISIPEMRALNWDGYVKKEALLFQEVYRTLESIPRIQETPPCRYVQHSPNYPRRFQRDWNRSFLMEPQAPVRGAAIFLHGLTDSPYTLRHLASHYQERGFLSYGVRLPGHGTVPAALSRCVWEEWLAALCLTVRAAKKRSPEGALHLVGFSNGGAVAVKYALDAIQNPQLPRADQLVLIAPMIGVFPLARFAHLAALPSHIPGLEKSSWLVASPEFNPFKYNSMHVNVALQSHRLSTTIKKQIALLTKRGALQSAPPILTFQSVEDTTVSTFAIVADLYAHLPSNGSQLLFFDVKRRELLHPAEQAAYAAVTEQMHPKAPYRYEFTVLTKQEGANQVWENRYTPGQEFPQKRAFSVYFPKEYTSLPHFALPNPIDDSLYGFEPQNAHEFGINLEEMKAQKKGSGQLMTTDSLFRLGSNPLFPYMLQRIDERLPS